MKTKTFIRFLVLTIFAAFTQTSVAQYANIKGKVTDDADNTAVQFSNIVISTADSVFVTGTASNMDGTYEIKNIPSGSYILSVSYMGYETSSLPVEHTQTDSYIGVRLKPSMIEIEGITIKSHGIIVKDDRKLLMPSQEQLRASTDGVDLVRKLQLPRIMVDQISGEISMSGNGEVQLRINGVQVSNAEIAALDPNDIVRIEYHDDPSARYSNAAAVIDYITRRRESGGNINASLMNNIGGSKTSADDMVAIKFNHGKSEFSANASFQQRKQHWTREYDENLVYPDYELHRLEVGEPTLFNKKRLYSTLNYSLVEKDKYFFNAQFRYTYLDFPSAFEDRKSKLYTSDSEIPLNIYDHSTELSKSPALDLYYQQHLRNNQLLIFNVVGTYINTDNSRVYQEKREDIMETDILSTISGEKYSIIGEAIYEKKIGNGKITAGLKHMHADTDNKYGGNTIADVSMNQEESFVYAEYQGKTGKFGYMANLTGTRIYYSQDDISKEKYALQPSARLTFEPTRELYFRYRINLRNNVPSLAYLNNVEQEIDPLQVRHGNPELNSFETLSQNFSAGFNKPMWGVDATVGYDYEFNPIMESIFFEDGLFVRTYENQQSFQNLSAEMTLKVKPWQDHISLSVTPRVNRFISEGNNYLHTYTMTELRAAVDFSYNKWIANFNTITPYRYFYGEQLSKSQQMYTIMLGYKMPKWSLMVGALSPFTKNYKTENENYSALNPVKSEIHTTHMTRTFLVKLNINLNYGHQFKVGNKRVNNSDTESGIMSGNKQ